MEVLTLCGRGKVFYETLLIVNDVPFKDIFCSHNSTGSSIFRDIYLCTLPNNCVNFTISFKLFQIVISEQIISTFTSSTPTA